MSELRQDMITKDWVIVATDRAKRPYNFVQKEKVVKEEREEIDPKCPFCPGNEKMTTKPLFEINDGGQWEVRVVKNKFPALSADAKKEKKIRNEFGLCKLEGFGSHEVIIETPRHNQTIGTMPVSQVEYILKAYLERYKVLKKDGRFREIIIFRNHGEKAGTSLIHPHSQIIASGVVSKQMRQIISDGIAYFDEYDSCGYCDMIKNEKREGKRIILETEFFISFCPFASKSPFQIYILPKRHTPTFGDISAPEMKDLAKVLTIILGKLYYLLNDPSYNLVVRTPPFDEVIKASSHWYIDIIPRLTTPAGFEMGSGTSINTIKPEDTAESLRNLKLENYRRY